MVSIVGRHAQFITGSLCITMYEGIMSIRNSLAASFGFTVLWSSVDIGVNMYTFISGATDELFVICIQMCLLVTSLLSAVLCCLVVYFIKKYIDKPLTQRSRPHPLPMINKHVQCNMYSRVSDPVYRPPHPKPDQKPVPPPKPRCSQDVHSTRRVQNTRNRQQRLFPSLQRENTMV